MFVRTKINCTRLVLGTGLFILFAASSAMAQTPAWRVSKASGEFWVTNQGVVQASVAQGGTLKSGETIHTGQTGRVLLVRGEESIAVSPNSVIGIPDGRRDGLSTVITQQAGSILLEVEKRNVKHFEVDTPYLAAVVKGTQFRVTVDKTQAHVEVFSGIVEVQDFKSGQYGLVQPGQQAMVLAQGPGGLSLSGSGALNPVQQGTSRRAPVSPVSVPEMVPASVTTEATNANASDLAAAGDQANSARAAAAKEADRLLDGAALENRLAKTVWWSRGDNLAYSLGVPFGVGIFVAVSVAVLRRGPAGAERKDDRKTKTTKPE